MMCSRRDDIMFLCNVYAPNVYIQSVCEREWDWDTAMHIISLCALAIKHITRTQRIEELQQQQHHTHEKKTYGDAF